MKKLKKLLFLSFSTTLFLTTPILANETTTNKEDYYKEISYCTQTGTDMSPIYT